MMDWLPVATYSVYLYQVIPSPSSPVGVQPAKSDVQLSHQGQDLYRRADSSGFSHICLQLSHLGRERGTSMGVPPPPHVPRLEPCHNVLRSVHVEAHPWWCGCLEDQKAFNNYLIPHSDGALQTRLHACTCCSLVPYYPKSLPMAATAVSSCGVPSLYAAGVGHVWCLLCQPP